MAYKQGGILYVPPLLRHVVSVFAVLPGAKPHCVALCDKQGVMRSYPDQGSIGFLTI